jgi:hypothetical protein
MVVKLKGQGNEQEESNSVQPVQSSNGSAIECRV